MFGIDVAPFALSGVVYTALLNDPDETASLGDAVVQAPYKALPVHPVLGLKPRNSLAWGDAEVAVPSDVVSLAMGPTLAVVIGRPACRLAPDEAISVIAGYGVANDISIAVQSHYRPALRQRVRDGFCVLGTQVVPADRIASPDGLRVRLSVDGRHIHTATTGARVRNVARLLSDVTAFMTLHPGDIVLLGAAHGAPTARAGQRVEIEIEGVGGLTHRLVAGEVEQ